jgi:outer membrane protein TolC
VRRLLPSFAFLVFGAAGLAAAEVLTWDDSLRAAAAANPDLNAARESVRAAESGRRAAYSPFLPQVTAGAGHSASHVEGTPGVSDGYSLDLSARQNLFAGGTDRAALTRASAAESQARASLDLVRADVGFQLRAAFARQLYAQDQEALARDIARRRQENSRLVELRFEAGREHKGSALRSRAAWSQADFEAAQAARALATARRALARVMGRSAFEVFTVTGTLTSSAPDAAPDFVALGLLTPSYRRQEAGWTSARAGVSTARGRWLPEVAASGSASRDGGDWPPDRDRWSLGLSASVPLFSGGKDLYDLRGAQADERRARAELEAAGLSAALDLEEAHSGLLDAAGRAAVQREFLEAARVRSEIARGQYTSGLLSFEDWDLIENDLINQQKSWLVSLRDAVVAEAEWDRTRGKGPIP